MNSYTTEYSDLENKDDQVYNEKLKANYLLFPNLDFIDAYYHLHLKKIIVRFFRKVLLNQKKKIPKIYKRMR